MWYFLFASPAMTTFAFVKLWQKSFLYFHIVLQWTYVVSCLHLAMCSIVECKCHLFICHFVNIQLLDAYKVNFSTLNLKSWIFHFWLPDGNHFYSTLQTTAILIYMCFVFPEELNYDARHENSFTWFKLSPLNVKLKFVVNGLKGLCFG